MVAVSASVSPLGPLSYRVVIGQRAYDVVYTSAGPWVAQKIKPYGRSSYERILKPGPRFDAVVKLADRAREKAS